MTKNQLTNTFANSCSFQKRNMKRRRNFLLLLLLLICFSSSKNQNSRRSRSGGSSASSLIMMIGLIFLIISPIISTLIKLAISRNREYLADSSSALLTRYPDGLARALKKLSADTELLEAANRATAHLYIVSPIKSGIGNSIAGLFDTHPPIEERIKRLESM